MQKISEDLQYDPNGMLGRGQFAHVYKGRYKGVPVALKRVLFEDNENVNIGREELALYKCAGYPNVVKLYDVKDSGSFRFYVLELCSASLDQLFLPENDPRKFRGAMPPDEDVLLQILNGLDHIHSKRIVHRDIKPGNILISQSSSTPHCSVKLADFGLSKQTTPNGTYSQSGLNRGTCDWMAPEYLQLSFDEQIRAEELPRGSTESDIFSAGCVSFYYVTRGFHPFGRIGLNAMSNILENKAVNWNQLAAYNSETYEAISGMIRRNPGNRLALKAAIQLLGRGRKLHFKLTKINLGTTAQPVDVFRVVFNPVRPLAALRLQHGGVVILKGEKGTDPLDSWKEIKRIDFDGYQLEWNANGTQLAMKNNNGVVVVWSVDGDQLRRKDYTCIFLLWNPFNPNLLLLTGWSHYCVLDASTMTLGEETITSIYSPPPWISSTEFMLPLHSDLTIRGVKRFDVKKTRKGTMALECTLEKRVVDYYFKSARYNDALKMIAFIAVDRTGRQWIELWPSDMSGVPRRLLPGDGECCTISWSPSRTGSDSYLSCGIEGSFLIWRVTKEIPTGGREDYFRIGGTSRNPQAELVPFSPDGRFLTILSEDNQLTIWKTGREKKDWAKIYSIHGARPERIFDNPVSRWDTTGKKLAIQKDSGCHVLEISSS